ncbi:MAG: hypothetical protein O9301_09890 [Leptospira sp.]|nr:hypothetical protein [Leptospira sp.]
MKPFDPSDFMQKIKLKEAEYLMATGPELSPTEVKNLLDQVLPKPSGAVQVLLQVLEDRLKVVTSDLENLDVFPTPLLTRDSGPLRKGFTLHRSQNGLDIQFVFSESTEGLFLSLKVNPHKGLSAELVSDGIALETLERLDLRSMFDTPIQMDFAPEIRILAGDEIRANFHFLLKS